MGKEYIEREALLKKSETMHDGQRCCLTIREGYVYTAPAADVVEVVHGEWEMYLCDEDACEHHRCSVCENFALFSYENEPIWDENSDGDIVECGVFTSGINEYLTPYCPICGAKMDGERKET